MSYPFKKIMILGCSGSGKTTLSRILEKKLGTPSYHIDLYVEKYKDLSNDSFLKEMRIIADEKKWIIDGGRWETLDYRLERADLILYLKANLGICLIRILKRNIKRLFSRNNLKKLRIIFKETTSSFLNAFRYSSRRESRFLHKISYYSYKVKILKGNKNSFIKYINTTCL